MVALLWGKKMEWGVERSHAGSANQPQSERLSRVAERFLELEMNCKPTSHAKQNCNILKRNINIIKKKGQLKEIKKLRI